MDTTTAPTRPGEAWGRRLKGEGPTPWEIRFRLDSCNHRVKLPPTLWTDVEVAGEEVAVRTFTPVPVLRTLCCSALEHGVDLPGLDVHAAQRKPRVNDSQAAGRAGTDP
jgi:hypothetical protein